MSLGVNDNIMALYRSQQIAKSISSEHIVNSCAPDNNVKGEDTASKVKKIGIGVCTAFGVAGSLMLLAKLDKTHKYSINPLKMLTGNIKNSYLAKTKYKSKKIVTIGTGSIIGGLVGGYAFGDKKDFQAKVREGIVQIANISFPIAFVEALSNGGDKLAQRTMSNWFSSKNLLKQGAAKLPAATGAIVGLITGMYAGNKCSNKLNEKLFRKKDDRPMKWKDFSAHVDDIGVAATFVAPNNIVTKSISRLIPAALLVAGYETGVKKESVDLNQ